MIGIGALSKKTGVNIETIRYYERIKIMPMPARTQGGRRLYDEAAIGRLGFIARSRQLGFSLKEIRDLLSLKDGHELTCAQVRRLTLDHASEVGRKINDLKKLKNVLEDMAAKCSGDRVPECPIIDGLFKGGDRKQTAHH